jgi:hypothetical protein
LARLAKLLLCLGFVFGLVTGNSGAEMNKFDSILSKAKPEIVTHWERAEAAGLPHKASNLKQVLTAFEGLVANIKALPESQEEDDVLSELQKLYGTLDQINQAADHGLLETDERELLVPIVIELAVAAGVDPDNHDGEPGGEFRDF